MSARHVWLIQCDCCAQYLIGDDGEPFHAEYLVTVSAYARRNGWILRNPGVKWYCPECREKGV